MELRRGLLNKHVLLTPVDRVRTVDITASPIHRVLGLTTVRVGTGTASKQGEDELALDGVRAHAAEAPRNACCTALASPEARASAAAPGNARTAAGFEPRWLWYAPFTTSGMVIAAAVLGAGSQVLDALGPVGPPRLDAAAERAARLSVLVLVPVVVVALLCRLGAGGDSGISSPTSASASPTRAPTTPGTCAAGCSRRARRAWTRTACAASTSSSPSGFDSPMVPGSRDRHRAQPRAAGLLDPGSARTPGRRPPGGRRGARHDRARRRPLVGHGPAAGRRRDSRRSRGRWS